MGKRICDRLAAGESLLKICKDPEMPSRYCVHDWIKKQPQFASDYACAKQAAGELFAEEVLEIVDADLPTLDDGRIDPGMVQLLRLRADTRKWVAAHLKPHVYGEKAASVTIQTTGPTLVVTGLPAPTSTPVTNQAQDVSITDADKP